MEANQGKVRSTCSVDQQLAKADPDDDSHRIGDCGEVFTEMMNLSGSVSGLTLLGSVIAAALTIFLVSESCAGAASLDPVGVVAGPRASTLQLIYADGAPQVRG